MSERIRVLQVVPDLSLGGAERMAVHLTQALDRTQFDVQLASLYDRADTQLDRMLDESDQTAHYLGKRRGFDARMFLALHRLLRRFKPHVVHTHTIALRYVFPVAFLHRIPVRLHTIHSQADKEAGRWVGLRRLAFGLGVVPVAIADEVAAGIRELYGIDDTPNIPNGIPIERYSRPGSDRDRWRDEASIDRDTTIVTIVGRLDPGKNHRLAFEALAELVPSERPLLLCAGEGSDAQRERLEAEVARLELADHVRLLGRRDDIPALLQASDLFLLPSDFEGNPLTVLEAMAAGLPVVATAVGGVPELVADEASGRLFPAGDRAALSAALQELLGDPEKRRNWGQKGQEIARERFSVSAMAERYQRLYQLRLRG